MKYLLTMDANEINTFNSKEEACTAMGEIIQIHREFDGVDNINIDDCFITAVSDCYSINETVIPF